MTDEQHGFAPEPPAGDEAVHEYAAGDTGTRAVPVPRDGGPEAGPRPRHSREVPSDEQPHEQPQEQSDEVPAEQPVEPAERPETFLADLQHDDFDDSVVPMRGGRRAAPRRARRGRGAAGCVAALVALVVVLALIGVGGAKGYHFVKDHLGGSAADYSGPGTGSVVVQVHQGDTATDIGRTLKSAGVVESVDAFIGAARSNPDSGKIQVGYYQLKKQMKASAALAVLVDHKNLVQSTVLVREGLRVADIVDLVAEAAKKPVAQVQRTLGTIKLPASADGNPEGYLYPATYAFGPHTSVAEMFGQMVQSWQKQTAALGLGDTTIDGHTYTAQQIVTVASLVQAEGKTPSDMAKIARVIYNRVEHPGAEGQAGMLQIDATVDYALHRPLTVGLTQAERTGTDSPYNTFLHPGLPPGPVGNPGADAIKAALHPADGDWYYYVTVNLATGETKFAHTYAEFEQYVADHQHYCATESASGCK